MEKATTISEAQTALAQMGNMARGLQKAKTVIDALASAEQVGRELDAAIKSKRATLTALATATIDDAKAEAQKQADAIVSAARDEADSIVAVAKDSAAAVAESVSAAKAELETLENKIAGLKQQARALAG